MFLGLEVKNHLTRQRLFSFIRFLALKQVARSLAAHLSQRGKDVGAIVSIEDLKLLEMLEDQLDIDMARKALSQAGDERILYKSLREKLGL